MKNTAIEGRGAGRNKAPLRARPKTAPVEEVASRIGADAEDIETAEAPRSQARQRMLDAAERLFAQNGYAGTSLRAVMSAAEVDTGAIHYHFKNKLGLLKTLFEERVQSVNMQREQVIAELEKKAVTHELSIEEVLHAFIAPALRAAYHPQEAHFNRVTALCSVDPELEVREIVFKAYDSIAVRFATLLRGVTPHLSDTQFQWRLECMYGAMMYLRSDNGRVSHMLNNRHRQDPVEQVIGQLVAFTAAGFKADAQASASASFMVENGFK